MNSTNPMELEDLQTINKSNFFPLLPVIKQENIDNETSTGNPCDSVEKQVDQTSGTPNEVVATKCVFCSQVLTANDCPKLLECLHIACGQCVTTKFADVDRTMPPLIHCPICNMASQNEFIIDNQFLIETINPIEDGQSTELERTNANFVKCSSCSDDASATSWCVDCSEFICDSCVQAHQRLKITKEHTIKPKEEANIESQTNSNISRNLMCTSHPQEKLSLFCETCDKLTCRDCQLVDHRDHKYKFAHEIATETRNALTSLLSDINYKRFLLTSAKKVIDDRQNMITDRKKDMIKDITDMVVKITNTVNARGKQLAMRVNEVCDGKLKILTEKKDALQMLSDNTDHCIDFVANALEKGSDGAILYSKKSLARHLQKLKCQRADIPNPEIPVRLNIQLNQIEELLRVCQSIGIIVVDGKPYPAPQPSPQSQQQQQQLGQIGPMSGSPRQPPSPNLSSPNMAPPLRPGLQPPGMSQISPGHPTIQVPPGPSFQNGPAMYNNSTTPQQQFNNAAMQMNRQFGNEAHVRFSGMGPVPGMQRQPGQPHVSSSTHPQNMDISLRGLLNNQPGQIQNQNHIAYNSHSNHPVNYSGGPSVQNGPSPPHQQMRQHYLPGGHGVTQQQQQQQQQCQNFSQNQAGSNGPPAGFMNNGPRFPQQYQRMNPNHPQGMSGNSGQVQVASGMRQGPAGMLQNNVGFPGNCPPGAFNQVQQQTMNSQITMNMPPSNLSVAKWHIPQSVQQSNGSSCSQQGPLMQFANGRQGENFKIALKSPNTLKNTTSPNQTIGGSGHINHHSHGQSPVIPNVTSTNPKTPSPSAAKDFTAPIDKVRDDSINDLMATIAKLDSNGVQVLPEGRNKTTSPQVHSSTDISNTQEEKNDQKDDPNEDWCAVCLDGGELMCCDKCPKVFHQNCHIPAISSLPDESETWQCLLCVNLSKLAASMEKEICSLNENNGDGKGENANEPKLTTSELKVIQRICLELYCQYDQSLPFREPEPANNASYYEIVTSPMSLDVIRTRLDPSSPNHYKDIKTFVNDVRLIFKNVCLFYQEDSATYTKGRYLESFFDEQLAKWLPKYSTASEMMNNNNNSNNSSSNSNICKTDNNLNRSDTNFNDASAPKRLKTSIN